MIDIDAQEERHYEEFLCQCQDDSDLDDFVWGHFADDIEQYLYWEENIWDESPYQEAFKVLYAWDAEYFCENMKKATVDYIHNCMIYIDNLSKKYQGLK